MGQTISSHWHKIDNAWKIFIIILTVNILQGIFSPLLWDEPYYWVWAKNLAWGYYDHPPMAPLLVSLGVHVLPGEIGVRLFTLILGSFTYYVIYRTIEAETDKPVDFKLAALLLFSSLFLNLFSFLVSPDTPLLFFAALFMYTYRRYLLNDNLLNVLLMGLVTALLLYSKYQGILLVGFTVLSNIKLLLRPSFYMVIAITLILFAPHIYWQIQNDYPTIRFHLFERALIDSWHDYNYLPKQLIFAGPVILLLAGFLYRPQNKLQKALKYNVVGIFTFFFISSFRQFVYTHWTIIAWPAMLCLAYFYIDNLKKYRLVINGILSCSLLLVIALRINFVFDFYKISAYNDQNPKVMTAMLTERAQGHPLVFLNMYNEPSYYSFYSGKDTYATGNMFYKKMQYNYMPDLENSVQGKTVSLVSDAPINKTSQKIEVPKGSVLYMTSIANFATFNTDINVEAADLKYLNAGVENTIKISIDSKLDSVGKRLFKLKNARLVLNVISKKDENDPILTYTYNKPIDFATKNDLDFTFTAPAEKGNYRCIFSVMTDDKFLAGFNSNTYNVKIR